MNTSGGSFYDVAATADKFILFVKDNDLNVDAHFHNSIEILFIDRGSCSICANGTTRILDAGDIFIANSYDIHSCKRISERKDFALIKLLLGELYCASFHQLYSQKSFDNFLCDKEKNARIFAFAEKWFDEYENSSVLARAGYASVLLAMFAESYGVYPKDKNAVNSLNKMVDILSYINQNYAENITLESICNHFGYSKGYFSGLFKKETGQTFKEYLNNFRILQFCEMKENEKEKNIIDLALSCGFESAATFYRVFRKKYGTNPKNMKF